MSFAAEMFRAGEEILQGAAQHAKDAALRELLGELLLDQRKNRSLVVERLRREYVTEMILEPIQGLREDDYEVARGLPERSPEGSPEKGAAAAEAQGHGVENSLPVDRVLGLFPVRLNPCPVPPAPFGPATWARRASR